VITDIQLAGTSGIEVTRRLKEPGSRVRLVVITASLDAESRALAVEAGADAYFVKPLDSGGLPACVESWSSGPQGRQGRSVAPYPDHRLHPTTAGHHSGFGQDGGMGSRVERELVFASTALQSRKCAPELLDALLAGLLACTGGRAAVALPCSNLESIAP